MKYSKLLNLGDILTHAPIHVVMRRSGIFPNYEPGTDIDLLVMNMDRWITYLSRFLPNYTRYVISPTHVQIDHWAGSGQLDLKFDLYSEHISGELTRHILASMELVNINGVTFKVPAKKYENLLKCYEYKVNGKQKYKEFARHELLLKPYL
jgi:hypothetical protein